MEQKITLPGLGSLDRLSVAEGPGLANADSEQLFGFNDVALARMKRFANAHNCIFSHANSCVVLAPTG